MADKGKSVDLASIFGAKPKGKPEEGEDYGEEEGEFETAAADALGTDDPDAIASLKQAILACMRSK